MLKLSWNPWRANASAVKSDDTGVITNETRPLAARLAITPTKQSPHPE